MTPPPTHYGPTPARSFPCSSHHHPQRIYRDGDEPGGEGHAGRGTPGGARQEGHTAKGRWMGDWIVRVVALPCLRVGTPLYLHKCWAAMAARGGAGRCCWGFAWHTIRGANCREVLGEFSCGQGGWGWCALGGIDTEVVRGRPILPPPLPQESWGRLRRCPPRNHRRHQSVVFLMAWWAFGGSTPRSSVLAPTTSSAAIRVLGWA